jgi:hypothetical protein
VSARTAISVALPLAAGVAAALVLSGCTVFGIRSGTEQPTYTVVDRLGEAVEIRRYGPRVAAETTVAAGSERGGRSQAFRKLFDYISGANQAAARISMTVPVETAAGTGTRIAMTAPVETGFAGDGVTMRFLLPAAFTAETAPAPTDPAVRIVSLPETTLAVLRFTGSTGERAVGARQADLAATLATATWEPAGTSFAMFYDPPWTLPFLRRNEVAVAVTPRG